MAGLHADNFGWYTKAQLTRVYVIEAENGSISIGPYGRASGPGIRFSGDADDAISLALTTSGATAIHEIDVRVSAYPASATPIVLLTEGGAVQVALYLATDGKLQAYRGEGGALTSLGSASTYVLPLSQYTRLAVKVLIHNSAGTFTVSAQGPGDNTPTAVLTLTGLDTRETASATWDGIVLSAAGDGQTDYCNWVVKDGSGSENNDLRGAPQNVYALRPNGDGAHSEWTRSTGIIQHVPIRDAIADDAVSYNDAENVTDIDTVELEDSPAPDFAISFVMLALVAIGGGGAEIAHVLRQGGTDYSGSGVPVTGSWAAYLKPYDTAPDATPWDALVWSTIQAGAERAA